jgi:hypothetical protein
MKKVKPKRLGRWGRLRYEEWALARRRRRCVTRETFNAKGERECREVIHEIWRPAPRRKR